MKKLWQVCVVVLLGLALANPQQQTVEAADCSIQSFTMSPNGTVSLGTHVYLEGRSNCGTVKFTVNGQSKAEIGSSNQTETLKTEEFGTGNLEVCFLGRGSGSWDNAAKSCKTLYVKGSGSSSSSSGSDRCWIDQFVATPATVQIGNNVQLAGSGQCESNARAVRFYIDGLPFGEFGGNTTSASWNTSGYSSGSHKVCFGITSGDWSAERRHCVRVTLKDTPQQPNPPAITVTSTPVSQQPAETQDSSTPSTSGSSSNTGSTSSSSCPTNNRLFNIGDNGRVSPGLSNRLRQCAGTGCKVLDNIPAGGEFKVIGGPTCKNNYWWWKVNYNGATGWTAEGKGSTYWLEKVGSAPSGSGSESENNNQDSTEELSFYYSPFQKTYNITFDTQKCAIVNGAELVATELNRSYNFISKVYKNEGNIEGDTELVSYLKNNGDIDKMRTKLEEFLKNETGCSSYYYELPKDKTMDSYGLGNVVYGYFSSGFTSSFVHGFADLTQFFEDRRADYPDDASQIDLGKNIANAGGYVTSDIINYATYKNFISSK